MPCLILYLDRQWIIDGMGPEWVQLFCEHGLLSKPSDFYYLDFDRVAKTNFGVGEDKIKRFGPELIKNLKAEIEKSKSKTFNLSCYSDYASIILGHPLQKT